MYPITLIPSFKNNLLVAKYIIIINLLLALACYFFSFEKILPWLESFLILFLGTAIGGMEFIAIAIHIQYIRFERRRKIEFSDSELILLRSENVVNRVSKKDVVRIISCDKYRESGTNYANFINSYYYLVIITGTKENIIITRLMSPKIDKIISEWSGLEIEHVFYHFPFIKKEFLNSALQSQ